MTFITDRNHLLSLTTEGIEALEQLAKAWLDEDQAACAPRSGATVPVSGGSMSDPTGRTVLESADRYADRDRLGRELYQLVGRVKQAWQRRQPRHTGGPCACCNNETATHGHTDEGRPAECFLCWQYRRKHGYHCDDTVHQLRPDVRMCECPPSCCDPCPDRVGSSRASLSDRCAMRKSRGLWVKSA